MPAQLGSAIVLSYGPQGAQQAGTAVLLEYVPAAAQGSVTIRAGTGAPWGAAQIRTPNVSVPFGLAARAQTDLSSGWGGSRAEDGDRSEYPWGMAAVLDTRGAAPWGRYESYLHVEPQSGWGVSVAADMRDHAPWGRYELLLQVEPHAPWGLSIAEDQRRHAPWSQFGDHARQNLHALFLPSSPLDARRMVPWSAFAHRLATDWGVVIPIHDPNAPPEALYIVPIRSVYMTINSLQLRRVDGNVAIPALGMSMSIDSDSWTWSFSATVPREAQATLADVIAGEPVELEATINGVAYRLVAERMGRDREFASTRIRIQGRGLAAALDAPYAPVLNFANAAVRTAQQLMGDVLTINGVGIGWDVDWQLTDWLVPAGAWAHQGSYISALGAIAAAAGGYLQPHPTAQTLRVLPRYAIAPWKWLDEVGGLAPDFELPAAVTAREGVEWVRKPAYNRVYVRGQQAGVLGQVTRAGTAGDMLAPMVTDPLITHADAARQRGIAILSDTGAQANVSLRLPVLAETGIILPGASVRYVDEVDTVLGIVRSTSLDWSRPKLRQTIGVQTHG